MEQDGMTWTALMTLVRFQRQEIENHMNDKENTTQGPPEENEEKKCIEHHSPHIKEWMTTTEQT